MLGAVPGDTRAELAEAFRLTEAMRRYDPSY
ncbi:hypothetical protein MHEC_31140 [Mycobacterium heckeshornense]|uniref:Uncharacterized protein n=1 Tax=Mycobacterium heckeshornense TaxID=110505 RepID=A0A7R7JI90_9MYCO|nr:hypothetical protein MHEC_31140 [Mycobacterium heckeshornense]